MKIPNIIFVGDEPSKTNTYETIAFVGAKCYNRVMSWINRLSNDNNISVLYLINSVAKWEIDLIKQYRDSDIKFIAFGNKASERLNNLNVKHFMLPHPSGCNLQINDKKYIDKQLLLCKDWIHNESKSLV